MMEPPAAADPSQTVEEGCIQEEESFEETRSEVSEQHLDMIMAARKLKGLVTHTHQRSSDAARANIDTGIEDSTRAAMEEYLTQKELLDWSRGRLAVELRRMKDLENNKTKLDQAVDAAEKELHAEALGLEGKPRFVEERLAGIRKELAVTLEEIERQSKAIHAVQADILLYENECLRADGKIRVTQAPPPDPRQIALEAEEEEAIAAMRVTEELRAADQLRVIESERVKLKADKARAVQEKIAKQIEVAAASHKSALERILSTAEEKRKWTKAMMDKEEEQHADRVDAILELKANTDKVSAEIRGQNEKAGRRRRARERHLQQVKEELIAAGKNPYVVFKQRDIDRDAARRKKELEDRVKTNQEALAAKIIRDMDYERKEEERKAIDKEYEKAQRDQLGRHVIEEQNRQYLMGRTTKKVDIIDPTGRSLRVDPSQVTTIVDRAFGLGYNPRKDPEQMKQILDLVRSDPAFKDVDAGEYARLLPKRMETPLAGEGRESGSDGGPAWLDAFLAPEKAAPGLELLDEPQVDEAGPPTQSQDEEGGGDMNASSASGRGWGGLKELSKFELDRLERARRLRQERLETGTIQTVGTRTFKGAAFVSRPEVIEFKDFAIDKPHRKRILLTNVSLTFNRFKLRDLPDEIRDFFEITYERPGRMCPGMTCAVDIIFTPRVRADIRSELCLLSETGPISIPLICTYPRVVPSLATQKVVFDNVVMGEKSTFLLTIRNDGAIPTRYTISAPIEEMYTSARQEAKDEEGEEDGQASEAPPEEGAQDGTKTPAEAQTIRKAVVIAGVEEVGVEPASEAMTEQQLVQLAALKRVEWLEEAKKGGGIFRFEESGEVGPYSQVTHAITFAPLEVGSSRLQRRVVFSSCDEGEGVFELELCGTAMEVPIFIPEDFVDLRCCVFGKLYRRDVILSNRGKIAYKMQASVPKELQGMLEFSPTMGFVQPGDDSDFVLQLKFRPQPDLIRSQAGRYLMQRAEDGSEVMAVPVQVQVPNQVVPVFFTLRAQLTTSSLVISPTTLRFGDCCYISESYKTKLKIKNESHLAQKVGFMEVPSYLDIQPNDGFNILLPQEELDLTVSFRPVSALHYDLPLTLRTSMNTTYRVRVTAQGVEPPVTLSHSVLRLSAACPGDVLSHDVFITNRTKAQQTIEFAIPQPQQSHLRVAPVIAALAPEQSRRVTLWFCPPLEQDENNPNWMPAPPPPPEPPAEVPAVEASGKGATTTRGIQRGMTKKDIADKKGGMATTSKSGTPPLAAASSTTRPTTPLAQTAKAGASKAGQAAAAEPVAVVPAAVVPPRPLTAEEGVIEFSLQEPLDSHEEVDPEPWSRHARWSVPCFIKPPNARPGQQQAAPSFIMLEVHTTTVSRALSLDPSVIDFGEMAVGQKKVVSVRLRNQGLAEATLEVVRGLSASGSFSILNAIRTVPPEGGLRTLQVQFLPVRHGISTEVLLLRSPSLGKELYIKLQGEGVNTALQLSPSDGRLDFGHVLEGRSLTQTLTLKNTSPFALRFELRPVSQPHENFNHLQPFQCLPCESEIGAGQSKGVEVTFCPDHARIWSYSQDFEVYVAGQTEKQYMRVRGRCWRRQLYVVALDPQDDTESRVPPVQEDAFSLPPAMEAAEAAAAQAAGLSRKPLYDIRLKFPREEGAAETDAIVRKLLVGSAAMPGGGGAAGTYEVELGEEAKKAGFFAVSPDKGSVAPEAKGTEVTVTYKPPAENKKGGLSVGQWVRYPFKLHLKGGYRPATDPETLTVQGLLEAFVYV